MNVITFVLSMFKDNPFTKNHLPLWLNTDTDVICKSSKFLPIINILNLSTNNWGLEYELTPEDY